MRRERRHVRGGARRYISTSMSTDPRLYALIRQEGYFAALLYTWLIPHAHHEGYLPSQDPEELMFMVIPGEREKDAGDVRRAIALMVELELLECRSDGIAFPMHDLRRFNSGNPTPERRAWQTVAQQVRPLILERDGYQCVYCGAPDFLEVDHIQALSRGGSNEESNLQTLCRDCNRRKSAN